MSVVRTIDPEGPESRGAVRTNVRIPRKPKVRDPERPSKLAFESTEDPYVPQRP